MIGLDAFRTGNEGHPLRQRSTVAETVPRLEKRPHDGTKAVRRHDDEDRVAHRGLPQVPGHAKLRRQLHARQVTLVHPLLRQNRAVLRRTGPEGDR